MLTDRAPADAPLRPDPTPGDVGADGHPDDARATGAASATEQQIAAATARDRRGAVVAIAVGIAVATVFVTRWSSGWLLLLDWAPGPGTTPGSGPGLPVGIGVRWFVDLLAALEPRIVGWVPPATAVLATYAGGCAVARRRPGTDGRPLGWAAATVGGCVAVANPFVASRLYVGQIGVLWGFAAFLFLVASLMRSVDRDGWRAWLPPGLWLTAAAAATVHLAVIGVVPVIFAAVVVHRRRGWRTVWTRTAATLGVATLLTSAWLVPDLLRRGASLGTAGGDGAAAAFRSGGPLSTLWARGLGGAGFWRPLPAGSLTVVGVVVALAWAATFVAGRHGRGHSREARWLLAALAAVAAVAVYAGRGPLADVWAALVEHVWPVGLLREPGKLAMLALPAPIAGAAAATQALADRIGAAGIVAAATAAGAAVVAVAGLVLLTALLPTSRYPAEWWAAADAAAADECPIAVLGDGAYTTPGFTGARVVANPARGFFGERALVSADAGVKGLVPPPPANRAERWAAEINAALLGGTSPSAVVGIDPQRATGAGVGWVFVDRPVDRPALASALDRAGFEPVVATDRAGLWRTDGGCR